MTRKDEKMIGIDADKPGKALLLMGNEAIARGALEAGIGVAAAYPGTPSSEIIDRLAKVAKTRNMYVEWSINEKVALEVAAAASLSGVRALTAMKQNGLNVVLDFLSGLAYTGVRKGLVLMLGDDAGGLSSSNEQDSRHIARMLDLPLLEPATFQEAKDMTKWAFELSEMMSAVCLIRGVTRILHARGNVTLGELPEIKPQAAFDTSKSYCPPMGMIPRVHDNLHRNLEKVRQIYEGSPFNRYVGPESPELLVITSGTGWVYSMEAIKLLSAEKAVGVLKLGTTWPLPDKLIGKHLLQTEKILVVEEVDPFLEGNVKQLAAELVPMRTWTFFGKGSGHMDAFGEINPDKVIRAISRVMGITYSARKPSYQKMSDEIASKYLMPRDLQFCAGCPHRATYWSIKDALRLDGRDGVVTGDIGCYSMGQIASGYHQMKTAHAMGSGVGLASGLGKLKQFDFNQPILTVCGDSTFFHASMPALLNSVHNESDFILLLLDNSGTAMTGFQPHPGIDRSATGDQVPGVDAEKLCRAIDIPVAVTDPYDVQGTREKLLDALRKGKGPRVVICKRECALIRASREGPLFKVNVNPDKCAGEGCGCGRYCTRVFRCPGLIWNRDAKKAEIDEAVCSGCGVCVHVCPQSAISREVLS
jgi:indolepyruvate ferredoxin oxidoreductase, alpha subunit